jgi:hypothetical protein
VEMERLWDVAPCHWAGTSRTNSPSTVPELLRLLVEETSGFVTLFKRQNILRRCSTRSFLVHKLRRAPDSLTQRYEEVIAI